MIYLFEEQIDLIYLFGDKIYLLASKSIEIVNFNDIGM